MVGWIWVMGRWMWWDVMAQIWDMVGWNAVEWLWLNAMGWMWWDRGGEILDV